MKKLPFLLVCFSILTLNIKAQDAKDGLTFSQSGLAGTARFVGMGGAFNSLGNDFTTLSWNPAGLGVYKSFDLMITPAMGFNNTKSTYNGTDGKDFQPMFNIANTGVVVPFLVSKEGRGLRSVQFAFGFNRLNDYNNKSDASGSNLGNTSLTDYYVNLANNGVWNDQMQMAYNCYLIDTVQGSNGNQYFSYLSGQNLKQHETVNTWGSQNEIVLSMGANYGDKLYIGGTLGFPKINYNYESVYSETDRTTQQRFSETDTKEINGAGVNFKMGAIYRPVEYLRLGLALHTPTYYYRMNYFQHTEMWGDINKNVPEIYEYSEFADDNFEMTTPMKVLAGVSTVIAQRAIISVEYEYQDPSLTRFWYRSEYTEDQNIINDDISYKYKPTHNIKIGGEYTYENYAFRAGYGFYSSPYAKNEDGQKINTGKRETFSVGLGYKGEVCYVDLAYAYTLSQEDSYFYNPSVMPVNPVFNTINKHNVVVTLGMKIRN